MEFLLDLGRKFRDRIFDFPFFFVNNCDGTRCDYLLLEKSLLD